MIGRDASTKRVGRLGTRLGSLVRGGLVLWKFCQTVARVWPVRRPPVVRPHVTLVRGREISHEFVAR